ncbi:hypothetical protein V6N13_142078 [Hibiscus sabdariffa]
MVKINVDAYFSANEHRSWLGILAHDYAGQVLGAARRINEGIQSSFEAEAIAVNQGLQFTEDMRHNVVRFRSCRFTFIGRNGNKLVHEMSLNGRSAVTDSFWVEDAPQPVLLAVASDRRCFEPP